MSLTQHDPIPSASSASSHDPRSSSSPTPVRVALAFVAAQIPLAAAAIAFDWPETDQAGSVAADVVLYGSPISGPIGAQAILAVLALLASRSRVGLRRLGTVGLAVMGLLITFNGAASALSDPQWAPEAIAVVGGIGFVLAGLTLAITAARAVRARPA